MRYQFSRSELIRSRFSSKEGYSASSDPFNKRWNAGSHIIFDGELLSMLSSYLNLKGIRPI